MEVMKGNRKEGEYKEENKYEKVMALFTAMYQVPLYLTPLFLGWVSKSRTAKG